ncbi:hypothetical protein ACIBKY_51330 [Nonomuraea sp. NPDC050394]|uniref:hypothetical protein n=1 Tax=Nonomuraea sp. NPDC050394 TaxID=3364363 RepID=UPI0037A0FA38
MSTNISAYITREEIQHVVGLLGLTRDGDNTSVSIDSTTVNGQHENPVTIYRAASECAERAAEEDFDPGPYPELFAVDDEFDLDAKDSRITKVTPIEEHDPDADRETARQIVAMLTAQFHLSPPGTPVSGAS